MKNIIAFWLMLSLSSGLMAAESDTSTEQTVNNTASTTQSIDSPSDNQEPESDDASVDTKPVDAESELSDGEGFYQVLVDYDWECREGCGDYIDNAELRLTKAAHLGNVKAKYLLGELYFGISQHFDSSSEADAIKWATEAAEQQYPQAHTLLGKLHKDKGTEALKWYRSGFGLGDVDAANAIGEWYQEYQKDDAQALRWFKIAAQLNVTDGLYHLAEMYQKNPSLAPDKNQVITLLDQAAKQGNLFAQQKVAAHYSELAVKQYQVAAERGSSKAMQILSVMYRYGFGADADTELADKWQRKSESSGKLQLSSTQQLEIKKELTLAEQYHKKAFDNYQKLIYRNDEKAALYLGLMYDYGFLVPVDKKHAKSYYEGDMVHAEKGWDVGGSEALLLGRIYLEDHQTPKHKFMAYLWFYLSKNYFDNDDADTYLQQLESNMPYADVVSAKEAATGCINSDDVYGCPFEE